MQKITKIFVMFFAITMLSMITVSASAYPVSQTASIQPRYVGVDSVISTLYISSSGRADVGGQLEVIPGYTASVTVTLYKDSNSFVQSGVAQEEVAFMFKKATMSRLDTTTMLPYLPRFTTETGKWPIP